MKLPLLILLTILTTSCTIQVNDFESCLKAGNPALESYPRQCIHKETTFTEEIWKLDDIQLRQHQDEGYYGCFGCNTQNPAICVDPTREMIEAEETNEIHCNENFEVIRE